MFRYYPSGFRVMTTSRVDEFVGPDAEVLELWKKVTQVGGFNPSYSNLKKVVNVVNRLVPDFHRFVGYQLTNNHLDDFKWTYLYDLFKFLGGQCSCVSTDSVIRMIEISRNVDDTTPPLTTNRKIDPKIVQAVLSAATRDGLNMSSTDLWFSKVNHLDEIVCTLYVLFGIKP